MAYRCEDCGKLCSVEQVVPEVDGEDINDGVVSGTVHIALESACCSSEIDGAEADVDFDTDMSGEVTHEQNDTDTCNECDLTREQHDGNNWSDHVQEHEFDWDMSEHTLSIDSCDAEADDWTEGTGGYRFRKHFWGASITVEVSCDYCGATGSVTLDKIGVPAGDLNQFSGGSFAQNVKRKKARKEAEAKAVEESKNKSTLQLSDAEVEGLKAVGAGQPKEDYIMPSPEETEEIMRASGYRS